MGPFGSTGGLAGLGLAEQVGVGTVSPEDVAAEHGGDIGIDGVEQVDEGIAEETIPFIPIFVSLMVASGFDSLTGVAVVLAGAGSGFAGAFMNPFTIQVAQGIAEIPLLSKESKVKELQTIVAEREDKAEELQHILDERQEKADGITAEVSKQINRMIEQVSEKMEELQASMSKELFR